MSDIFEKLGLFYLGKDVDEANFEPSDVLTLMKSKHFTTHAAIIGMTGSGKTGLGIDLIEEAAIDNIPAIVIDPKGDMGNLCLTFEGLRPKDFEPWVKDEAQTKGEDVAVYAEKTAKMWKKGLKSFQQDVSRIKKLKAHDVTIYTPGSSAGVRVSVLSSLDAPGGRSWRTLTCSPPTSMLRWPPSSPSSPSRPTPSNRRNTSSWATSSRPSGWPNAV